MMVEYIDREDVLKLCREGKLLSHDAFKKLAREYVAEIPAADVKPVVHGKWIWDDEGYHCSECFFHAYDNSLEIMQGIWNYCPHCGATMDGEQ